MRALLAALMGSCLCACAPAAAIVGADMLLERGVAQLKRSPRDPGPPDGLVHAANTALLQFMTGEQSKRFDGYDFVLTTLQSRRTLCLRSDLTPAWPAQLADCQPVDRAFDATLCAHPGACATLSIDPSIWDDPALRSVIEEAIGQPCAILPRPPAAWMAGLNRRRNGRPPALSLAELNLESEYGLELQDLLFLGCWAPRNRQARPLVVKSSRYQDGVLVVTY
ncbi:MAG: hypothetical protein JWM33_3246 [Caulobacteraceae bacterium]|nr:hypothetical protein [Caulobacteraceae bacterium]